jgi:hypothetical protein
MPPTWATPATTANSGTTLTASQAVNVPAGVANGNGLLLVVAMGGDRTVGTPAGWTPVFNVTAGANPVRLAVWWRQASTEPASYTLSATGGTTTWSASMHRFTGADPFALVDVANTATGLTAPTVQVLTDDSLAVYCAAFRHTASRTFTAPTGYTERADVQSTASSFRVGHTVATRTVASNSGALTGAAATPNNATIQSTVAGVVVIRPPRPPAALATTVRGGLVTHATNDPWRNKWLTSAAARTAWTDGILAEIDLFRAQRATPYMRARWLETRNEILAGAVSASTLTDLDSYFG